MYTAVTLSQVLSKVKSGFEPENFGSRVHGLNQTQPAYEEEFETQRP